MPDKFSQEKRSQIMSKIRSKNTDIERALQEALKKESIYFQYQPKLFGKPDFLIPPNIVVFCDSSFWHGRNWEALEKKLSNDYWRQHIKNNIQRDKLVTSELMNQGYLVLRFWDYQIKKETGKCIAAIQAAQSAAYKQDQHIAS